MQSSSHYSTAILSRFSSSNAIEASRLGHDYLRTVGRDYIVLFC